MLYEKLQHGKKYTKQELFTIWQEAGEGQNYNSFKWILGSWIKKGLIGHQGRNQYVAKDDLIEDKPLYHYFLDREEKRLEKIISDNYPSLDFVLFKSSMLNDFLNHLIGHNTYFVFVEKGFEDVVARRIMQNVRFTQNRVLVNPDYKQWDLYWISDCIVVLTLKSEIPVNHLNPHCISLEQLLVDLIAERVFENIMSESEINSIYNCAITAYKVDFTKILRYAKRRGKTERIRKIWEEVQSVKQI